MLLITTAKAAHPCYTVLLHTATVTRVLCCVAGISALMIGLVVLFVVILPLLAAFVYIAYKQRDQLKILWENNAKPDRYR